MGSMGGVDIIKGPVGQVISLIVWLVVFSLIIGAINGWYLQSVDSGVVSGERFDRIVVKAADDSSADDRWAEVTVVAGNLVATVTDLSNTQAYMVKQVGTTDACQLAGADLTTALTTVPEAYTPLGSKVQLESTDGAPVTVAGCKWSPAGSIFGSGPLSGLIEIILQAAGLAPPIALMYILGTFGSSFIRNMGSHPLMAAIMTVIAMLLVATLLNTFVPFLTSAFNAIDANRFVMYAEGLGSVSTIISGFFGVVVVSSMMMIAWTLIKSFRSGNAIQTSQRM